MASYRIGIAFFYHESHTFSPVRTTLDDFIQEGYHKGEEILAAYTGTKTEVGGFIDVVREKGGTMVPLLCAAAIPSGPVTRETYEVIRSQMLDAIEQAGEMDGLLLALHGAMVVEGVTDPEVEMLAAIREKVGESLPIATTLDMHANLGRRILDFTPLHFGFKTYPHVDMYEQGCKAATMLYRRLDGGTRFYASFVKLRALLPSLNMRTAEGPMHDLVELAKKQEQDADIVGASIFGGFPYADIPEAGASVLVVGTDQEKTRKTARFLAQQVWENRERFVIALPKVRDALQSALQIQADKPIALADISDNPLSGGTGDTTELLREMIALDLENALFGALYDEESLQACMDTGAGATIRLSLGGKLSPEFGPPVEVDAKIMALTNGVFTNKGPMNTGLLVDTNGAAHIRAGGLDILLTGRALSANDPELFRHIGIEPTTKRILGLKVKNHFRAAFDPLVSQVIYVDAPGLASNDFTHFAYKQIPRPIWPLDEIDGGFMEEG